MYERLGRFSEQEPRSGETGGQVRGPGNARPFEAAGFAGDLPKGGLGERNPTVQASLLI